MAEFYTIKDLDVVAFLSMQDITPISTKTEGKLVTFLFEYSEEIETLVNRFYHDPTLMTNPKKFALARKYVKYQNQLKAEKQNNNGK